MYKIHLNEHIFIKIWKVTGALQINYTTASIRGTAAWLRRARARNVIFGKQLYLERDYMTFKVVTVLSSHNTAFCRIIGNIVVVLTLHD